MRHRAGDVAALHHDLGDGLVAPSVAVDDELAQGDGLAGAIARPAVCEAPTGIVCVEHDGTSPRSVDLRPDGPVRITLKKA